MQKLFILLFSFSFAIVAFSQKKYNPKIAKNETEIAVYILGDLDLAYGAQIIYRVSAIKKLKVGAGILYGANYEGTYDNFTTFGYGAVFADALQLLDKHQKWGVGGQIGKGIYSRDFASDKITAGIYYSVLCNYRAIISKKLLLSISLLIGHRNFHYKNTGYTTHMNFIAFTGLKFGIVF